MRPSIAHVSFRFTLTAALSSFVVAASLPTAAFADEPMQQPKRETAQEPSDAPMPAPYGSPFGPGYDPTRPPPTEPLTSGPGIAAITVTAHGPAEVEEMLKTESPPSYYAVALAVRIPEASTTPVLGKDSVTGKSEDGTTTAVEAICFPTAEPPVASVYHGAGARLSFWHVAAGGKTWQCGGRNARLAVRLGEGGLRFTVTAAWEGPMLLIFRTPASPLRRITVAGVEAEIPPRDAESQERPKADAGLAATKPENEKHD